MIWSLLKNIDAQVWRFKGFESDLSAVALAFFDLFKIKIDIYAFVWKSIFAFRVFLE